MQWPLYKQSRAQKSYSTTFLSTGLAWLFWIRKYSGLSWIGKSTGWVSGYAMLHTRLLRSWSSPLAARPDSEGPVKAQGMIRWPLQQVFKFTWKLAPAGQPLLRPQVSPRRKLGSILVSGLIIVPVTVPFRPESYPSHGLSLENSPSGRLRCAIIFGYIANILLHNRNLLSYIPFNLMLCSICYITYAIWNSLFCYIQVYTTCYITHVMYEYNVVLNNIISYVSYFILNVFN